MFLQVLEVAQTHSILIWLKSIVIGHNKNTNATFFTMFDIDSTFEVTLRNVNLNYKNVLMWSSKNIGKLLVLSIVENTFETKCLIVILPTQHGWDRSFFLFFSWYGCLFIMQMFLGHIKKQKNVNVIKKVLNIEYLYLSYTLTFIIKLYYLFSKNYISWY